MTWSRPDSNSKAIRRYRYVHGELTNEYIGVSVQFILTNDPKIPHDSDSWQTMVDFYSDKPVPCVQAWNNAKNGAVENLAINIVPTQIETESPIFLRYKNGDISATFNRT